MMDKNVLDYVVEKTNDLMGARHAAARQRQRPRPGSMRLERTWKRKKPGSMWRNWKRILCRLTA